MTGSCVVLRRDFVCLHSVSFEDPGHGAGTPGQATLATLGSAAHEGDRSFVCILVGLSWCLHINVCTLWFVLLFA